MKYAKIRMNPLSAVIRSGIVRFMAAMREGYQGATAGNGSAGESQ
jgi:hypothetical protein